MSKRLQDLAAKFPITTYFDCDHLPTHLQQISRPICELAREMATILPPSAEVSAGLRKLLEAKDCLVRARVDQHRQKLQDNAETNGTT